jgi:hypothetical protein
LCLCRMTRQGFPYRQHFNANWYDFAGRLSFLASQP